MNYLTKKKENDNFLIEITCRVKNILYKSGDVELIALAEGFLPDQTANEEFEERMINNDLQEDYNYYLKNDDKRERIIAFIKEQDRQWAGKRRMEFLEQAMRENLIEIKFLENLENFYNGFFFDKQKLNKEKAKYKNNYIEFATIRGQKEKKTDLISSDVIERCRRVPIAKLNPQPMKNGGRGRMLSKCPFHNDKTPSFWVFEENSFHCFGCQANGQNAIDFIMKLNNVSFREAVEFLKYY